MSSPELYSDIDSTEFKRVLSNLIDNAFEAIVHPPSGNIKIELKENYDLILISIMDNGKGIPPHVLTQLGAQRITSGKIHGNGLGVGHAKYTIERWGGTLKVESKVRIGTQVFISIPKVKFSQEYFRTLPGKIR
jgi:two-component system sporulation sensor kinase A